MPVCARSIGSNRGAPAVVSGAGLRRRADSARGRGDCRSEPQELPGSVLRRDLHPPPRTLHGQGRAVQRPFGVADPAPRRVPRATRRSRCGHTRHRPRDTRFRRTRGRIPRGHPRRGSRSAGVAAPRRRQARARDGCADRPGRDHRHLPPLARSAPQAQARAARISTSSRAAAFRRPGGNRADR